MTFRRIPIAVLVLAAVLAPLLASCGDDDEPTEPTGNVMVLIPAGTFTMGSPTDEPGRDSEEAQHTVTLMKSFYLSTTEVTQADWLAVMGWNESYFTGDLNRPVESVTWFDAADFCNKKSIAASFTPAYTITGVNKDGNHITAATVSWNPSANGYRLPTEAEWEYACRAGTQTAFANGGITYSYCDPVDPNLDLMGWYCGNSGDTTHAVKGKSPNTSGLYDMHGNVLEWCWDWYGAYAPPYTDPVGGSSGSYRVIRGGSWDFNAQYCRSAYRYYHSPDYRRVNIGFRLSRTAS